jgi:outer membrane protein TolC
MRKHDFDGLALSLLLVVLACPGFAQQTTGAQSQNISIPAEIAASNSSPTIGLDECLAASQKAAPGLTTAKFSLDTATAQLAYAKGSNGLTLGESGSYTYAGSVSGALYGLPSVLEGTSDTSSASSTVAGNNVKAGLALSGPETSVGVAAQQGISSTGAQSTALSVTGSQVVYDGYPGGSPRALVSEAEYTYNIAQVNYDTAQKSVAYQTKTAYFTLLGDQKSLIALDATVKDAEEELKQMQGYLAAGRATTLDVLQVQVALTQARLNYRTGENTVDVDRQKLSLAVGWPLGKKYSVADAQVPTNSVTDTAKALETAFANRQELRTYGFELASAVVDLALQKSKNAPTVSLNGSLGMAQAWAASTLESGQFSAGVSVALPPIYDGKQQESLVRQKGDTLESFRVQEDQERQSIEIDVRNALFSIKDSSDRLDLAKQSLEEAQGVYEMQKAKFMAGSASSVDVMTAFSSLAAAQVSLETAKSTYNLAILNLDNVEGL